MYCLSDKQIDYILNDIRARGVEMEDLQLNLLDHVCCIIEQKLEVNGDFERFYQTTIASFYKQELWEIEEETLILLTFKNYYTMKKIMIMTGGVSAFATIMGVWFKYMHWPGASALLSLGILSGCLVFLPLMFILKAREQPGKINKFLTATGALCAMMIGLSFLFKVMHWPGVIGLIYFSTLLMALVFLPLYFYTGIRNPATRVNAISSSVLIILGYGLILLLVNTRPYIQEHAGRHANQFLQQSYEVMSWQNNAMYKDLSAKNNEPLLMLNRQCNNLCSDIEKLKVELINKTNDVALNKVDYNYLEIHSSTIRLDNFDIPTSLLFDADLSVKPALLDLRQQINSLDELARTSFKIDDFNHFFEISKDDPAQATTWEKENFYRTPLSYLLRNLTQVQLNVRYAELSCIASYRDMPLQASLN